MLPEAPSRSASPGADLLARDAALKGLTLGAAGQLPSLEAWLPF